MQQYNSNPVSKQLFFQQKTTCENGFYKFSLSVATTGVCAALIMQRGAARGSGSKRCGASLPQQSLGAHVKPRNGAQYSELDAWPTDIWWWQLRLMALHCFLYINDAPENGRQRAAGPKSTASELISARRFCCNVRK
jgi:hypothetical protein